MKYIDIIFLLLSIGLFSSCRPTSNHKTIWAEYKIDSTDFKISGFKPFPFDKRKFDRDREVGKIIPNINYKYWELVLKDDFDSNSRGSIVVYKGDSLNYAKYAHQINSDFGFFHECQPDICISYIVGVKDKGVTDLIDTESKFKSFIGKVDNLEEVILIANLNRYHYDSDSIIGGGYKERKDDYLLYLLNYTSGIYKSVRAILTKKGEFRFIDEKTYKMKIDNTII